MNRRAGAATGDSDSGVRPIGDAPFLTSAELER